MQFSYQFVILPQSLQNIFANHFQKTVFYLLGQYSKKMSIFIFSHMCDTYLFVNSLLHIGPQFIVIKYLLSFVCKQYIFKLLIFKKSVKLLVFAVTNIWLCVNCCNKSFDKLQLTIFGETHKNQNHNCLKSSSLSHI